MNKYSINKTVIAGLALGLFSCQALRHNNPAPFKIKDAIYYSWFVNEKERGTNVELTVAKLNGSIQFEAIIFRNIRIPVATIISENSVLLKGVIPGPESILPDRSEPSISPNRLLFIRDGDSSSVNIEIKRVEMKYFKSQ